VLEIYKKIFQFVFLVFVFSCIPLLVNSNVFASEKIISIPDGVSDFPIFKATPGARIVDCVPGANSSNLWVIQQWSNEQSLCLDTNNAPVDAECQGADLAKETSTARFCYYKNQKKVHMTLNTEGMSYQGCYINRDQNHLDNLGGYSIYLMNNLLSDFNNFSVPWLSLPKLSNLFLSTQYSTDFFQSTSCPVGVNDPIFGRDPAAMAYMDVFLTKVDPVTHSGSNTVMYHTVFYDNRPVWQTAGASSVNCSLPGAGTQFIAVSDTAAYYGMPIALPGTGVKTYQWDVLPRLKYALKYCLGNNVDMSNFRVTNFVVGNEMLNSTLMSNTFINPQARLVSNDLSTPVGFAEENVTPQCLASGWVCDADSFSTPLTVEFYDSGNLVGQTVANLSRTNIASSCGGKAVHGFNFPLSLSSGTHQITVKALDLDSFGNSSGTKITLLKSPGGVPGTITATCQAATPTPTISPTVTIQPTITPTATPTIYACDILGDVDCSGMVDGYDLTLLLGKFNQIVTGEKEDIDGSGQINSLDLAILFSNYGK
jgi:hypothetical protein